MSGFELNTFIARSPGEVFDFLINGENASKIIDSVVSMDKLTEGPVGVGTRYRETRLMKGKEQQTELEIAAFEPGRKYAMKNVTEGITTTYHYHFHPDSGGTRVELICEIEGNGLKKLILPVVASILKKEDGDHLERLKEAVEA